MYRKFNVAVCHSHKNENLVFTFMGILDSRSTDCGYDRGRLICLGVETNGSSPALLHSGGDGFKRLDYHFYESKSVEMI